MSRSKALYRKVSLEILMRASPTSLGIVERSQGITRGEAGLNRRSAKIHIHFDNIGERNICSLADSSLLVNGVVTVFF